MQPIIEVFGIGLVGPIHFHASKPPINAIFFLPSPNWASSPIPSASSSPISSSISKLGLRQVCNPPALQFLAAHLQALQIAPALPLLVPASDGPRVSFLPTAQMSSFHASKHTISSCSNHVPHFSLCEPNYCDEAFRRSIYHAQTARSSFPLQNPQLLGFFSCFEPSHVSRRQGLSLNTASRQLRFQHVPFVALLGTFPCPHCQGHLGFVRVPFAVRNHCQTASFAFLFHRLPSSINGKPIPCNFQLLMNENSGRDHSHRSSAHPNPRLGFSLLGFTKSARNQSEPSFNIINLHSAAFSLALCEIQSVERRLGELFRRYRDGEASSSGIQSHSILGCLQS